ncbi:MAG TPA: metal ABC transporter permease [Candidatus Avacidaminococcus intestinavium]|uniref:Metal ABC transporter permease n=1 Tax=Candidatus Avacidaminococcus intestinavium TaxID=2840684 RepID=A0A9D1MPV7_9FIRM|nr:metal ABC transporter permease [Candidatus Avacidaminococcus intestinavium]
MDLVYSIIGTILPFEWTQHNFMKNALLAILLVMPLFGLLGTMVVNNRLAFFSDSLGHGAFTGVALGSLLGIVEPLTAVLVFSLFFAGMITWIKHSSNASTDTIIGVFSSLAIAIGLIILSYSGNVSKYSAYLIGDLLSINRQDLSLLVVVFILTLLLWSIIFNNLLVISVNPSLAASRGISPLVSEMMFAASLAAVVAISIQWVGLLVINSMLVLPAAAARNISSNMRAYHLWAVLIALFAGLSGLIISYYGNVVTGATIALISSMIFFVTFILRRYIIKA